MVEIKLDSQRLRNIQKQLAGVPKVMPRVISAAINKTASKSKTEIGRRIRDLIMVKAKYTNKAIRLTKASYTRWRADLDISPKKIPLIGFSVRQGAKGVSSKIEKQKAAKLIQSAFIQTLSTGHKGVFARSTKKRFPIYELFGPSLAGIFDNNDTALKAIESFSMTELHKNINSQIDRHIMKKIKAA